MVPAVVQVVHPMGQAEQVAVPPGEVVAAGQAKQVPEAKPKLTSQVWHVTLLQVAHPLGQAEQDVAVPPGEVVAAAQAVQAPL